MIGFLIALFVVLILLPLFAIWMVLKMTMLMLRIVFAPLMLTRRR